MVKTPHGCMMILSHRRLSRSIEAFGQRMASAHDGLHGMQNQRIKVLSRPVCGVPAAGCCPAVTIDEGFVSPRKRDELYCIVLVTFQDEDWAVEWI
jgi:hypothetical protein